MANNLTFSNEAREKMFNGVEKVYKAVSSTLGPRGHLAVIDTDFGVPTITKDGVSVAKVIDLEDKVENLGCQLVKDIASKSNEVGDGTTTATILGYALAKEGLKAMSSGCSAVDLKNGMDKAIDDSINLIKKSSKSVESATDIYNVAKVSSNNDEKIASLISEAFEKIGNEGLITVSESNDGETHLSFKEGMNIDKGWLVPQFVNNDKMECELKDSFVLVTDETISSAQQIAKILESVAQSGKPLTIIADDVTGEALPVLVINNMKGSIRVNVVKAPSYGDFKTNILEDIAIITGAEFVSSKYGLKLKDATIEWLGSADKIVSTKNDTIIVGGHGDKAEIEDRISRINASIKSETSDTSKDKLKERLAKLTGGVCILNVYAQTEPAMKELKDRIEDTLSSVRASIKEGIVLGGGATLLNVSKSLTDNNCVTEDEKIGYNIVKKALEYPIKKLAENADMSPDVVVDETLKNCNGMNGYDFYTRKWDANLISKVVDPTLVEITALKNASSIVGLLLNSDVTITKIEEKKHECNCNRY